MELVRVSDCDPDILDGQFGCLQKLDGFVHPVGNEEFLRAGAQLFTEDPAQVIAVDFAGFCDIRHGDIVLEILINVGKDPFQILFAHPAAGRGSAGSGGPGQTVQKQVQMGHEMEDGLVRMACHIEHGVFHPGSVDFVRGAVDRLVGRQSGRHQGFLYMHTVKFHPCVLPWVPFVCHIGGHLPGNDQEPLPASDMVSMVHAMGVKSAQRAAAGDNIVEQIVIPDVRSEGAKRPVVCIPVLVHAQVDKTLIFQYIVLVFHGSSLFSFNIPECT